MRKFAVYALILFQIMLIGSLIRSIQLAIKARSRVVDLESKRDQLVEEQKTLAENLEYVKSDYYVEKVAREELQLVKPGETVVIVPEGVLPDERVEAGGESGEDKPNYIKWWEVVRGGGIE